MAEVLPNPPLPLSGALSTTTHLGFDGKSHRHRMGLRRVVPGTWLEPDSNAAAQRQMKRALLKNDAGRVRYDSGSPAAHSAVATLVRLLEEATIGAAGEVATATTSELLDRAALSAQEDWCLMIREDTWRLHAACVCFPSRWVLAEKRGATIAEIHQPVPMYDEQLGGMVEGFMDRLSVEKPVWRLNWNLWDDPRLFQPTEDPAAASWEIPAPSEVGGRVFLRVERQTLRRLSDDVIAFGIRVHQRPLQSLVEQPGALQRLKATISGLEDSGSATKKLGRLNASIRGWVDLTMGG